MGNSYIPFNNGYNIQLLKRKFMIVLNIVALMQEVANT